MSSAEQTPNLEMNSEFRTCAAKAILQRVLSVLLRCPRRLIKPVFLAMGLLMMAALGLPVHATGDGQTVFKHIRTQFIAALGDPDASAGSGAQSWGLWRRDPGPRGVWLDHYEQLKAAGGLAPAKLILAAQSPDGAWPPGIYPYPSPELSKYFNKCRSGCRDNLKQPQAGLYFRCTD